MPGNPFYAYTFVKRRAAVIPPPVQNVTVTPVVSRPRRVVPQAQVSHRRRSVVIETSITSVTNVIVSKRRHYAAPPTIRRVNVLVPQVPAPVTQNLILSRPRRVM